MGIYQFIQTIDNSILNFISDNLHSSILDKLMILITTLGNDGIIWIIIGLALTISGKYRRIGILMLISLALTNLLGEVTIKNLAQRPRPCADLPEAALLIEKPLSYSFPSGHTAIAFASVVVLSTFFKKYKIFIYSIAVIMGFSRMYLYVHYPTDVIMGAILGLSCSNLIVYLYEKRINYVKNDLTAN